MSPCFLLFFPIGSRQCALKTLCTLSWNDSSCWDRPHWEQPNASVWKGNLPLWTMLIHSLVLFKQPHRASFLKEEIKTAAFYQGIRKLLFCPRTYLCMCVSLHNANSSSRWSTTKTQVVQVKSQTYSESLISLFSHTLWFVSQSKAWANSPLRSHLSKDREQLWAHVCSGRFTYLFNLSLIGGKTSVDWQTSVSSPIPFVKRFIRDPVRNSASLFAVR